MSRPPPRLSAIGAGICEVKSLMERARCGQIADGGQAAIGRSTEAARYGAIREACQ